MSSLYSTMILLALAVTATANMYDITFSQYTTNCSSGCIAWSDAGSITGNPNQTAIDAMFVGGSTAAAAAGASCAMPAAHAGNGECDCGQKDEQAQIFDSYSGPWCFCKDPSATELKAQYCAPPVLVPEQINLQIAAPGIIVVGFVTYEDTPNNTTAPIVQYGLVGGAKQTVSGVTHTYAPPGRAPGNWAQKPYQMHYVRLTVEEKQNYEYAVKAGASQWSDTFTFRAPAQTGPTRVATYGDMGHSHYNCMGNVLDEAKDGVIDAVVHMGDHCYNLGFDNDRRGDAYMNAWQPALTTVPWFPIIGNHEASDGDHFKHYEAIAYGEAYGVNGDAPFPSPDIHSTATTALGAHLTQGTFYGMGLHGAVPSNTSRYASANIGLIHMVGLDLNNLDDGQLAWLEADLAAVDRSVVPWIMVMSHFPIFHSKVEENANMSYAHYAGDELLSQYETDGSDMHFAPCEEKGCMTVKEAQLKLAFQLQPIFKKYGVDIYNAGHVHSYETTWPLCDFTVGELCNGTQSYVEPKGTMHITEGNGGVPGVVGSFSISNCTTPGGYCRNTGKGGAHAVITAWNATHLTYEHVQNNGGSITDSFTLIQSNHGSFPMMK